MSDGEDGTSGADDGNGADSAGGASSADDGPGDLAALDGALRDRFTWYVVAKKEFRDTVRSKLIWLLSAIFVIIFALPAFLGLYFDLGQLAQQQGQTLTTDAFFQMASRLGSALIPIIAIVIGYGSIVGERESGSLKLLLSQPFSRRDVLLGKVVGRSAVVALPILLGFVVSAVVLMPAGIQLNAVGFVLAALLTALLGVVFVGLAVGISAASRTSLRAIVGTVGLYVYFFLFWNSFANSVGGLLREYTDVAVPTQLKLSLFLKLLNPTQAYQTLVNAALGESPMTARMLMFNRLRRPLVCQEALGGNVTGGGCVPEASSIPFYFSNAAVLVYLLLWLVIPVFLGYRLFQASDL